MMTLADFQKQFMEQIYQQHKQAAMGDSADTFDTVPASQFTGAGFSVYVNNTHEALQDSLTQKFPIIEQLLGSECFRQVCRDYIYKHPLRHGNRSAYGECMDTHIAAIDALATLPYLADVARFEWAYFTSSIAISGQPITLADIQQNPEKTLIKNTSHFAIGVNYNVIDLWKFHQDPHTNTTLSLVEHPHHVLIWKDATDSMNFMACSPELADFINNCDQQPFCDALTQFMQKNAGEEKAEEKNVLFQQNFNTLISNDFFIEQV